MAAIRVRYVDGTEIGGPPETWPNLRGDGIDWIELVDDDDGAARVQGRSLYWLYRDSAGWVVGGANVPSIDAPVESVLHGNGFEHRTPRHMPDLTLDQIKLGWWLPEDGD